MFFRGPGSFQSVALQPPRASEPPLGPLPASSGAFAQILCDLEGGRRQRGEGRVGRRVRGDFYGPERGSGLHHFVHIPLASTS